MDRKILDLISAEIRSVPVPQQTHIRYRRYTEARNSLCSRYPEAWEFICKEAARRFRI